MAGFGENIAPVPIAMSKYTKQDGPEYWIVDLHIKVARVTEFDISAEGSTLSAALRSAYLGLNNEEGLKARAHRANTVFVVRV